MKVIIEFNKSIFSYVLEDIKRSLGNFAANGDMKFSVAGGTSSIKREWERENIMTKKIGRVHFAYLRKDGTL